MFSPTRQERAGLQLTDLGKCGFKIGNRTFLRFGIATPSNHAEDRLPAYSEKLGVNAEVDSCDDDKPAAEVDTLPAISNANTDNLNNLPSATIRLGNEVRARRGMR